jgi:hypothetical protein
MKTKRATSITEKIRSTAWAALCMIAVILFGSRLGTSHRLLELTLGGIGFVCSILVPFSYFAKASD